MNRLDKIRAQHAEHDMSDSDEFYLLGRVAELEEALVKALRFIPPNMNAPKTLDAALAYFVGSPAGESS